MKKEISIADSKVEKKRSKKKIKARGGFGLNSFGGIYFYKRRQIKVNQKKTWLLLLDLNQRHMD